MAIPKVNPSHIKNTRSVPPSYLLIHFLGIPALPVPSYPPSSLDGLFCTESYEDTLYAGSVTIEYTGQHSRMLRRLKRGCIVRGTTPKTMPQRRDLEPAYACCRSLLSVDRFCSWT